MPILTTDISRCPYCHDDCHPQQDYVACRACRAPHHEDCWDETQSCASCQNRECLRAPITRGRGGRILSGFLAIPTSLALIAFSTFSLMAIFGFAENSPSLKRLFFCLTWIAAPTAILASLTFLLWSLTFRGLPKTLRSLRKPLALRLHRVSLALSILGAIASGIVVLAQGRHLHETIPSVVAWGLFTTFAFIPTIVRSPYSSPKTEHEPLPVPPKKPQRNKSRQR